MNELIGIMCSLPYEDTPGNPPVIVTTLPEATERTLAYIVEGIHPDGAWCLFTDTETVVEAFRAELDAMKDHKEPVEVKVTLREMTQAEIDAVPEA